MPSCCIHALLSKDWEMYCWEGFPLLTASSCLWVTLDKYCFLFLLVKFASYCTSCVAEQWV